MPEVEGVDTQAVGGEFAAHDLGDALGNGVGRRIGELDAVAPGQREADGGMGERQAAE